MNVTGSTLFTDAFIQTPSAQVAVAAPLPQSAWAGLTLLGSLSVFRTFKKRTSASVPAL